MINALSVKQPLKHWHCDEITLFCNCVRVFFQKANLLSQTDRINQKIAFASEARQIRLLANNKPVLSFDSLLHIGL